MRHKHPALHALSDSLAAVVAAQDEKRLRELLQGRALPALGGGLPASEIIRQALYQATKAHSLARGLAALLARIVCAEAQTLRKKRSALGADRRRLLLDSLRLAAELPAQADLSHALRDFLSAVQHLAATERFQLCAGPHCLPLWEALSYQQTDSSLEAAWLDLLQGSPEGEEWTPGRRTLLLIAWRGLLWIPPPEPNPARGEVVSFDRVETGLLALAAAVRGHEEAGDLLREALEILRDTFPRSAEFWEENLRPRIGSWPEDLREKALEVWPGLHSHNASAHGSGGDAMNDLGQRLTQEQEFVASLRPETTVAALNAALNAAVDRSAPVLSGSALATSTCPLSSTVRPSRSSRTSSSRHQGS